MPAAYPPELRQRVVNALIKKEGTYAEIAERFAVGVASVDRWWALHRKTGSVAPKAMGGRRRGLLTEEAIAYLRSLVRDEPNWTTTELAAEIAETHGIRVSRYVIGRTLKRQKLSFKRGSSGRRPGGRRA